MRMEDIIESDNIISSVMSVASDIATQEKPRRIPKLFFPAYKNYQFKKLKEIINKIAKANIPLSRENLSEYLRYVYNTYRPNGEYKQMKWVRMLSNGTIEGYYVIGLVSYVIKIPADNNIIDIDISYPNKSGYINSFKISTSELYSTNRNNKAYISTLNADILNDIKDYLLENIRS